MTPLASPDVKPALRPAPRIGRALRSVGERIGAWLLPSEAAFDALRIFVLAAVVTTFFLYVGCIAVHNGAAQYEEWADALVSGGNLALNLNLPWRDVGYALILLLAGFPWTHSFIGLMLIQACMALAIPLLAYFTLRPWFPRAAYWTALASVVSLAPCAMFKTIHHDQSYIFFMMVALWSLARHEWTGRAAHLYGFTLSVFAMSLIRLIGQGMYPLLLLLSYFRSRANLIHHIAAALLFAACTVLYSHYRDEVLSRPRSVVGMHVFHNVYKNLADYNVRISPDLGPHSQWLVEHLHDILRPSPAESPVVLGFSARGSSPESLRDNFLKYSADELVERILTQSTVEYYVFIRQRFTDWDLLMTSYEMARGHPAYVLGFTLRNAFRLLFEPGYTHARFVPHAVKEGNLLPFSGGNAVGYGRNIDDDTPEPALTQAKFLPLVRQPAFIQDIYFGIQTLWWDLYHPVTKTLFWLMAVAWASAAVGLLGKLFRRPILTRWSERLLSDRVAAATWAISVMLFLNVGITALLVEPLYRFAHSVLMLKIMLAGVGAAVVVNLVRVLLTRFTGWRHEPLAQRAQPRRPMGISLALAATATLAAFIGWVWYINNVAAAPPSEGAINVVEATLGANCGGPANNALQHVHSACFSKKQCDYRFDWRTFEFFGPGCFKEFHVKWTCAPGGAPMSRVWPPEPADRSVLQISCP